MEILTPEEYNELNFIEREEYMERLNNYYNQSQLDCLNEKEVMKNE